MDKDFIKDLLNGTADILEKVNELTQKKEEIQKDTPEKPSELLTAHKLEQLKWISAANIAEIYKYGKVKTQIADDPNAYAQLKWFSKSQLEAIFGKAEEQ